MRRGLVFGKYMPLHRGHELVIETAFSECDDVTIVIYDSNIEGESNKNMPIQKRLGWLRDKYPHASSIVALDDPFRDNMDRDKPEYAQAYADQLKFLGHFDNIYTSETNYDEFAKIMGSHHNIVDSTRVTFPICGTTIRKNPYNYRDYMDSKVYKSLIQKVVFVGSESTGKTTLAKAMAGYSTEWAHEYGRELWGEQGWSGTFQDHLKIATTQYQREENILFNCDKYLFCDTNAWTTLQWSLMAYGTADKRLYDLVERTKYEYIWVLCDNDFGWIQDGTRELDGIKSINFQKQQRENLDKLGVEWFEVYGNLNVRKKMVKKLLERLT